ncbi:MAG: cyclic nucleotide-binding domain-containing protein [Planctomycetaceae bacterium]
MAPTDFDFTAAPLFQNMTLAEREAIAGRLRHESYAQGDTVLREGRSVQILWIIARGRCEVVKTGKNGSPQQLAVLEQGTLFGEMSFFRPAPHSASIRTLTEVEVFRLDRADYDDLEETNPGAAHRIAVNVTMILADRLRKMDEWICDLVARPDGAPHRDEWREFRSKLYSNWQF